jgi:hypothetical protein
MRYVWVIVVAWEFDLSELIFYLGGGLVARAISILAGGDRDRLRQKVFSTSHFLKHRN